LAVGARVGIVGGGLAGLSAALFPLGHNDWLYGHDVEADL
jgi:hypothetical protein